MVVLIDTIKDYARTSQLLHNCFPVKRNNPARFQFHTANELLNSTADLDGNPGRQN